MGHLDESDISIDQHVKRCAIDLGRSLQSRRAVYLDMRFWILLRDVIRNRTGGALQTLLDRLREKTREGLIFCPISEDIFVELMKQSDLASRVVTAELIEELSLGVAIVSQDVRIGIEIENFLSVNSGQIDAPPLETLVWCKLGQALGILYPSNTAFDAATECAIQKAFFNHMCTIPLTKLIVQRGDANSAQNDFNDLANRLNLDVPAHAAELRSFKQAYNTEVRGIVDFVGAIAADKVHDIAASRGVSLAEPTKAERTQTENTLKNLMALALEKRDKAQKQLRTMHILASLHASLRWNKGQKYNSNGLFDFHHASAAIAYCSAFFTDGPLCTMIKQQHVNLDTQFECCVTADVSETIAWIEGVNLVKRAFSMNYTSLHGD